MFYARYVVRRLFGGPLPPEPEFDDDLAIPLPVLREARDVAQAGDWQAAGNLVKRAGEDWDLQAGLLAEFAGAAADDDGWLYAWLRAEPANPAAVLLQAKTLGYRAGAARGSRPALRTSAEQFAKFRELSDAAAQVGRRAMELASPNDPQPWTHQLGTMFADSQAVNASFDAVYAEGQRRDPHNFDLHSTAITLRCAKWFGSHEQMFAMARAAAEAAPAGHKTVLLPLHAHFEYAMREFAWAKHTDKKAQRACRRYFRRPEVRADIDHWIAKFRAGTPTSGRLNTCRQWMALYYSMSGRKKPAKIVFDELGQYVSPVLEWVWFWGDREYGYHRNWWWANGVH
ncbi:hypothetical protein GCM10010168_21900 [Actinoplanes ianthinogenes]|uniref:DUF4034 domain-containing protein n=1 Tax=Actinoplanes ianthinogenes TaxID=122358 RepID=A0ABM7M846_9ACTN|nr:hypothetical protein [Actinoplanes ianthinogenes]BCJ47831.1 hypothetical protein Aiant_84880 [Actinoplanes ianthinogenes]GGR04470.1 hypothetical protein GCM10010168_21900 [Actinoplanes ianthinogenes]